MILISEIKDAGADWFTVAIDCATEEIFDKYGGKDINGPHKWDGYWKILKKARPIFGEGEYWLSSDCRAWRD